jgi:hypothetical protein
VAPEVVPERAQHSFPVLQLAQADGVETILAKRGLSIAGTAGKPRDLPPRPWIRKFARLDVQRLELWAFQPPSRRAKRAK